MACSQSSLAVRNENRDWGRSTMGTVSIVPKHSSTPHSSLFLLVFTWVVLHQHLLFPIFVILAYFCFVKSKKVKFESGLEMNICPSICPSFSECICLSIRECICLSISEKRHRIDCWIQWTHHLFCGRRHNWISLFHWIALNTKGLK